MTHAGSVLIGNDMRRPLIFLAVVRFCRTAVFFNLFLIIYMLRAIIYDLSI